MQTQSFFDLNIALKPDLGEGGGMWGGPSHLTNFIMCQKCNKIQKFGLYDPDFGLTPPLEKKFLPDLAQVWLKRK